MRLTRQSTSAIFARSMQHGLNRLFALSDAIRPVVDFRLEHRVLNAPQSIARESVVDDVLNPGVQMRLDTG